MAKKATLNPVANSTNSIAAVNIELNKVNDAFDNTLSLDGSTPNAMEADLDMNSNDLLNVKSLSTDTLQVAGVNLVSSNAVPDWKGVWVTSTNYVLNDMVREAGSTYICIVAHTSGTFSTDLTSLKWDLMVKQGAAGDGTGDMIGANNLSDVVSASTSRSNIGLGTLAVENTAPISQGGTGSTTASGAFDNLKQDASTTVKGVVERSTSAENIDGTSDTVYPTVLGTKEMIDTHSSVSKILHIRDEQPSGTNGGSATAGSFETRPLNTVVTNEITGASLSSNQITLPAGNYEVTIMSPAHEAGGHQARFQNITDDTTTVLGLNSRNGKDRIGTTHAFVKGKFTILSSKVFELQHRVQYSQSSSGMGQANGWGTEVYADVHIEQL